MALTIVPGDAFARDAYKENHGRLATVYSSYDSYGQGSIEIGDRVDFGLTFVEVPFVAHGAVCDADEIRNVLGLDDNDDPPYPVVSGHVTKWDTDEDGNYAGAWVAVTVQFLNYDYVSDPLAQIHVEHHFHFTAVAIKTLDGS